MFAVWYALQNTLLSGYVCEEIPWFLPHRNLYLHPRHFFMELGLQARKFVHLVKTQHYAVDAGQADLTETM